MTSVRTRLTLFYRKFNPEMNTPQDLEKLLKYYEDDTSKLFERLCIKYITIPMVRRLSSICIQRTWRRYYAKVVLKKMLLGRSNGCDWILISAMDVEKSCGESI